MNPTTGSEQARRLYVQAFNSTMVSIWKEKIALLGVVDTGALYNSVVEMGLRADGTFTSVDLRQGFLEYGLYQDAGTGREVPCGNPGDIGRDKVRERRQWFSRKYYASVMNLREFFADNLGSEMADTLGSVLGRDPLVLRLC